jgi:hypothetical protein
VVTKSTDSRLAFIPIVTAALLSAGFTSLCATSHAALAVTFGGLLAVTLTVSPLASGCNRLVDVILVAIASILAVDCVWLFASISWPQWWACAMVLAAYALCLAGLEAFIRQIGVHVVVSCAIVMIAALAWLSWPIWLSPWLPGHQTLVNALVIAHPPLAINGELIDQGIWTERPQMYGWTALNQDVSYSMPSTVFWCVAIHAGLAGAAFLASIAIKARWRLESQARAAGTSEPRR